MFLLQLVQKYFPTSSSFSLTAHLPEQHVSGAAPTHLLGHVTGT
jgi:hypothetical protein